MKVYLLKPILVVSISLLIILSSMQMPVHGLESKEVINTKADGGWLYYPPYPNYSPSGMPDFSGGQQSDWYDPNDLDNSIGCSTLAFANIIWYMDSLFSNNSGFPGDGKDEFPLVIDYNALSSPNPGPFTDDHNFNNVNDPQSSWDPLNEIFGNELIETIRIYTGAGYSNEFLTGLKSFINDANLTKFLNAGAKLFRFNEAPTLNDLQYYIQKEAGVVLGLGRYDENGKRVGGHSIALAGVNINESLIAISDSSHDFMNPTNSLILHNDAQIVSHDIYEVFESEFHNKQVLEIDYWSPHSFPVSCYIEDIFYIIPNKNPPSIPEIIGPITGKVDVSYSFNFTSIDPDRDKIQYLIDWNDTPIYNWSEQYNSSETVSFSHTWTTEGNYSIRVKAKDELGRESDWSDPLVVSMPKNKETKFPLLHWFLEKLFNHFPFIEPYLHL